MKNLIQDTIEKIKKQKIAPEPKWRYLAKKYFLWALFSFVVILAAVSFSAAYDNASNLDWDLYPFMHQNRVIYFLSIVPYFWVVLIAFFLLASAFEIRRTETGYRYSWLKIVSTTVVGTALFASLMLFLGFGGKFNSVLAKNFPSFSRQLVVTKESQWMQPEKGFLAGTIISVSDNKLEIDDLKGNDWNIQIDEKTSIRPSVNVSEEEMIKIIGTKQDANNFKADEIRPWNGKGMGNRANGRSGGVVSGNSRRGGMMQEK
jgi:hypothetical protein